MRKVTPATLLVLLTLLAVQLVSAADPQINVTVYPIVAPTVDINTSTNITHTSGTLQGEIAHTGNDNPHTRGFDWGLATGNYTSSWNETGSFGTGTFNHTVNNLSLGTTVFFRAFATNTICTAYSGEGNFTTLTLPFAPTNFVITQVGVDSANITWTKGAGANNTIIRGSTVGYPFSVLDGDNIYSSNSTWVAVGGLDLTTLVYYYRAWSENEFGYSTSYAQARIPRVGEGGMGGDMTTTIIGIICLGAMISGFAFRQSLILLCAGIGWVVFGALMFTTATEDFSTPLFALGLAFALVCFVWPLVIWMRTRTQKLSASERDYESYRQQVLKATHRNNTEI